MSFAFEPRHWIMIVGAVILAALAFWGVPHLVPVFTASLYAFPLIALALILDTLGDASEGRRAPWKALGWLSMLSASFAALWPLSSLLGQLKGVYGTWMGAGQTPVRAGMAALKSLGQYSEAQQTALMISAGLGIGALAIAVGIPLRAAFDPKYRRDRKSRSGPWRAGWMNPKDIAYLARNKVGMPLAIFEGKTLRYAKNDAKGWRGGHHLVVSGTRGGKGVSTVIPAILEHQGPVVALDIKGENFAVTRRHRQNLGRQVVVLNPFGLIEPSEDQFNPLDYIRPDNLSRDIHVLADGLVRQEQGDGAHFSEMARELIAGAIEVIVTQEDPDRRNLVAVADLLFGPNLEEALQTWAKSADLLGHRPAQIAATIMRASDKERGSILTSASKAFSWMQSDEMRHFLERSSFDMDGLLDDRIDLFIAVPLDQVDKQAVFMRLFINLVLGTALRQAGKRKMKAPTLLALDEFVRLGRMEQMMNIATVAAGVGFDALFVTQDTGQVAKAYGEEDASSLFASCITKRIFNTDIKTAEWAMRHLGESTVYSQQIKEDRQPNGGRDYSYAEQRQKLMTADQITEMKADELLLLVGNRSPLKAKLNRYFENRAYKGWYDPNPLN